MKTAFVTGATGLLGNNLTRALLAQGVAVTAMVRDPAKATRQFGSLPGLRFVKGDMQRVEDFAGEMVGADVLFHTAAYFRDSFGGGNHWDKLYRINVDGTRDLLAAAQAQGIRRVIHTSSIAVLKGPEGGAADETMLRDAEGAADYFRSKILTDRVVYDHLERHPDMDITLVLPGWMHGPGDMGPTSGGQFTLDFLRRDFPGVPPTGFAFVDARDVAAAQIAAVTLGRRGERYLAAGRAITAADLFAIMEKVSGVAAPTRVLPMRILSVLAEINEVKARIFGGKVLLSRASVENIRDEAERRRFDHSKSERELGLIFRPIEETLKDEMAWFKAHGFLDGVTLPAWLTEARVA